MGVKTMRLMLLTVLLSMLAACGPQQSSNIGGTAAAPDAQIYRWKLITTWPKNLPGLGTAPEKLADKLRVMSNGRLDIKVYGAGELVGPFEVFDAVAQGTQQCRLVDNPTPAGVDQNRAGFHLVEFLGAD